MDKRTDLLAAAHADEAVKNLWLNLPENAEVTLNRTEVRVLTEGAFRAGAAVGAAGIGQRVTTTEEAPEH